MAPLQRILEPEVMNTLDEAVAYDAMDHADVNRTFVVDVLEVLPDPCEAPVDVLDLGTGTAQIPIELCRRREDVRVLAVDAATSMLDVAIGNIDVAGVRDRIQLSCVNAKALPYDGARFSVVISNSIVHHIPDPAEVLREAVRVVRPGGLLFFRDLLRPRDEGELQRLVEQHAATCDEFQRRIFADSLRAALSLSEMQSLVDQLGFPAESVRQTSDRHWTWTALRPA